MELTHAVRRALQGQMDGLQAGVRASQVVHCDETGWREDGQNGYVWACVTEGREVYEEAQAWVREQAQPTSEERQAAYARFYERICALGQQYAQTDDHPCRVLARRLLRHQEELFQFACVPDLPADNNPAERRLRPVVITRKISGGTHSPAGTRTRLTLASVFATWVARQLNPFRECLAALQRPTAHAPP